MPKGYVIARAIVTDAEAWGKYAVLGSEAIKKYGGTLLARGGKYEVAEGEGRPRNVVIEFKDFETARAYAFSAEYDAARQLRANAGTIDLVVVEGV